jgi:hypothetical protein
MMQPVCAKALGSWLEAAKVRHHPSFTEEINQGWRGN